MMVTKNKLDDQLQFFPEIRRYMVAIAKEKLRYHQVLIKNVITRYQDPTSIGKLIEARMKCKYITTHISLKRQINRKKFKHLTKQ